MNYSFELFGYEVWISLFHPLDRSFKAYRIGDYSCANFYFGSIAWMPLDDELHPDANVLPGEQGEGE